MTEPDVAQGIRQLLGAWDAQEKFPHGRVADDTTIKYAGEACVELCGGNQDTARTLWKIVVSDNGGYMPRSAALALYRAAHTGNLVPDVEAPDPS